MCNCFPGYELIEGRCQETDECLQTPCHTTAVCKNTPGSYLCSCPDGLIGDPISAGCRAPGECLTDTDCPDTALCKDAKCRNPCEDDVCGTNALCTAINHAAVCECTQNSRGDPYKECIKIECEDKDDCATTKTCVDAKCIEPCSLPNVCGKDAKCTTENHLAVCLCPAGTTGDPQLGCVPIQYCSSDQQCPGGSNCNSGVCSALCSSSRDCLNDQLCIEGICQPTCQTNSTCPEFQFCLNNICTQEVICHNDEECDENEICVVESNGRSECVNPCQGRIICGRNAECLARNHEASCNCKPGFYEDAKGLCRKIECNSDDECTKDKFCQNHMCKIACLVGKPCGDNSVCTSMNHKSMCECQPGFTGDSKVGCTAIDYCKANPCGLNAKCKNSRGSFRCHCPSGMVGDAYKDGCRPPVECEKDGDCPNNAKCADVNGEPKCKDVCEEVTCGPNAECNSLNHKSLCVCRGGFDGDANNLKSGCSPIPVPCDATSDCPENTYCHESICKCKYQLLCVHFINHIFASLFFKFFYSKIFSPNAPEFLPLLLFLLIQMSFKFFQPKPKIQFPSMKHFTTKTFIT